MTVCARHELYDETTTHIMIALFYFVGCVHLVTGAKAQLSRCSQHHRLASASLRSGCLASASATLRAGRIESLHHFCASHRRARCCSHGCVRTRDGLQPLGSSLGIDFASSLDAALPVLAKPSSRCWFPLLVHPLPARVRCRITSGTCVGQSIHCLSRYRLHPDDR